MKGSEKPEISWSIKRFDELSLIELHDLLKVRMDIFVVEQNCAYAEIDGKDPHCFHALGSTAKGEIIATARIAPAGLIYEEWSIGRVVVRADYRNMDLGYKLMNKCINFCRGIPEVNTIKIAAQLYLERFYSNLGFKQISDIYPWDGIDHIDMRMTLREAK